MELTPQDKLLVYDLVNIAWQAGAVKNPQMAQLLEQLRAKVQKPGPEVIPAKKEDSRGGK